MINEHKNDDVSDGYDNNDVDHFMFFLHCCF